MLGALLIVAALGVNPTHDVGADFTEEVQLYLDTKLAESELRIKQDTAARLAETERVLLARVELVQLQLEKLADTLAKLKACECKAPELSAVAKPLTIGTPPAPAAAVKPAPVVMPPPVKTVADGQPREAAYTAQSVWVPTKRGRGYTYTRWVPMTTLPPQSGSQSQANPQPQGTTYCTKQGCFLVSPN